MLGYNNTTYPIKQLKGWKTLPSPDVGSFFSFQADDGSDSGYYTYWDNNDWIIQIQTSGTLEFLKEQNTDIFLVGAGGNGGFGKIPAGNYNQAGGRGGGGGASCSIFNQVFPEKIKYYIQVGYGQDTKILSEDNQLEYITVPKGENGGAYGSKTETGQGGDEKNITGKFVDNATIKKYSGGKGGAGAIHNTTNSKNVAGGNGEQDSVVYAFDDINFQRLKGNNEKDDYIYTYGGSGGGGGSNPKFDDCKEAGTGINGGGNGGIMTASSSANITSIGESPAKKFIGAGAGGNTYGKAVNDPENAAYNNAKGSSGIIIIRSHKEDIEEPTEAISTVINASAANALVTPDLETLWQRINELETELSALKESNTTPEESNSTETNQEDNLND